MNLLNDLSDWIFPRICFHCGERLEPSLVALCTLCRFYGYPMSDRVNTWLPEPMSFLRPLWVFEKGGSLQKLIHAFKYGGVPRIGLELGECMGVQLLPGLLRKWAVEPEKVLIVPVPLHPARERQRGYNQAQLLAEGIGNTLPIRVAPKGWIIRKKPTRSQTGLSPQKRSTNLKEAFRMCGSLEPLEGIDMVLILDDVFTTGATLFSLMQALEKGLEDRDVVGKGLVNRAALGRVPGNPISLRRSSQVDEFVIPKIIGGITLAAGG